MAANPALMVSLSLIMVGALIVFPSLLVLAIMRVPGTRRSWRPMAEKSLIGGAVLIAVGYVIAPLFG